MLRMVFIHCCIKVSDAQKGMTSKRHCRAREHDQLKADTHMQQSNHSGFLSAFCIGILAAQGMLCKCGEQILESAHSQIVARNLE